MLSDFDYIVCVCSVLLLCVIKLVNVCLFLNAAHVLLNWWRYFLHLFVYLFSEVAVLWTPRATVPWSVMMSILYYIHIFYRWNNESVDYKNRQQIKITWKWTFNILMLCMMHLKEKFFIFDCYLHIHHDVSVDIPDVCIWKITRNDEFCALKMNKFLIRSSVLVTLRLVQDTEADGNVWLCAAWWKTACQMRHGSINLGCWPLHAHRQDKWIHGTTFGRLDESAACQLLYWSSFLLLMNRTISKCITFELSLLR